MFTNKKSWLIYFVAMLMVFTMVAPFTANAANTVAVQPRASDYLNSYNAYVYLPGGGEVRVYFNVEGTGFMDEVGALSIEIHESRDGVNWDWVETYNHYSTSGMLSYNDDYHSGYVSYNGTAGKYYKAYVCVWAGKNGSGDSRYFWTSTKH